MLHSFLSLALAVTLSIPSLCITPKIKESSWTDSGNFSPVVRFLALSDTHVTTAGGENAKRLQKAILSAYAISESDEEYRSLDAVLVAGDLTNRGTKSQFRAFDKTVGSVLHEGTTLLAVLGNNHDCKALGKSSLDYYQKLTGESTDFHTVIGGFHFIGISAAKEAGEVNSASQRRWLAQELKKAAADGGSKPIFVMQHEHVRDTVFGSSDFDGWGTDFFRDILEKYPQVVDFSGHSHYPLNDPRSVWQGAFTAVGTGALAYTELTLEGKRKVHPADYRKTAAAWIVEVDAENRVRLRGFDVLNEKWLCTRTIENPSDKENRPFSPAAQALSSLAPEFPIGASITVAGLFGWKKASFRVAYSNDASPVFLYRAYLYDKDGKLLSACYYLPRFYTSKAEKTVAIPLGRVGRDAVTVKVVAETAYGVQSEPLIALL